MGRPVLLSAFLRALRIEVGDDTVLLLGAQVPEAGGPSGDLPGDVLRGEAQLGVDLRARRVVEEPLRNTEITTGDVDPGRPQRGGHGGTDTAVQPLSSTVTTIV